MGKKTTQLMEKVLSSANVFTITYPLKMSGNWKESGEEDGKDFIPDVDDEGEETGSKVVNLSVWDQEFCM